MYKIFEKLCKSRGVTPYFVGKETGVQNATLSAWKNGRYHPKDDKMEKIAEFFEVPLGYLKGTQDEMQCPQCHMDYSPVDEASFKRHEKHHKKFMAIQKRYGMVIPSRAEAEKERMDSLAILRDIKYDKFRRISAFSSYAKYDFICALYASDFDLDTDLDAYTVQQAEKLSPDDTISMSLCNAIRAEFGVDEYKKDLSISITEREYRLIQNYRSLPPDAAALIDKVLDVE